MANIYYLNSSDFSLEGGHMVANIGGLTFILFHSQRCDHCKHFLPEFKTLPGNIRGVNFGLCCVDESNRSVIQMSRTSSTPISAVPKFVLYNDGIPLFEYNLQRSKQAILTFLNDIIQKLDQKQSFTSRPRRTRQPEQQFDIAAQQMPVNPNLQLPTRPGQPSGQPVAQQAQGYPPQQQQQQAVKYKVTPSTGVKEYETSYGRPYNTSNENDFLEYEQAYIQQQQRK